MVAATAAPERLLSPADVAAKLNVTEQTLAHWRSSRRIDLPYVAISRRCVKYRERDVDAFIVRKLVNHASAS